jgi:hypothetical protein
MYLKQNADLKTSTLKDQAIKKDNLQENLGQYDHLK